VSAGQHAAGRPRTGRTAPATTQLRALLRLRAQMVRTPGLRLTCWLAGTGVLWLLAVCLRLAPRLPPEVLDTVVTLAPEAFLGFAVLALVAPLTAGGGLEVVPPDQLVAFPVRPSTHYLGGLVLAPVNLVWVLQLLVLAVETGCLTLGGSLPRGALTTVAYVVCVTAAGQSAAWGVAGLRRSRRGRRVVAVAGPSALVAVVVVVQAGLARAALTRSPTRPVVRAVVAGGAGDLEGWAAATAALGLAAGGALLLGSRMCAWALRRPGGPGAAGGGAPVRRRRTGRSALRELVAVDRASVWRAPALRRGALVLAVVPGLVAAGTRAPWESLAVLPGLVAAGAGLLFGVNAFCLDGSGALWLASLPHDPDLAASAKLVVTAETVLGAVVVAAVTGSLGSPGSPTAAQLTAIVAGSLACTAVVLSAGFSLSVRHPHRADLRGPRDAVAPPGALAVAGIRLTLPTALTGLLVSAGAATGRWWLPPLLALPVLALAALSMRRSLRRWADPVARARVVQIVSAG